MAEKAEDEQASDPFGAPGLREQRAALLRPGECQALPRRPLSPASSVSPLLCRNGTVPLFPLMFSVRFYPCFLTGSAGFSDIPQSRDGQGLPWATASWSD